jgi:hypothetical protein
MERAEPNDDSARRERAVPKDNCARRERAATNEDGEETERALAQCLLEQQIERDALAAPHAEKIRTQRGCELGLCDWVKEEILLRLDYERPS